MTLDVFFPFESYCVLMTHTGKVGLTIKTNALFVHFVFVELWLRLYPDTP